MMIHLGRNPFRGRRPPRDSNSIISIVARNGMLFHSCDRESVVVLLFRFRIIKEITGLIS